ncbi:MAG: cell envelope integrity EipB family protein [Rhodospirillales bacterium]|jgi:hypothetical protein|nr:cell envelope integrity EipB family protein [Rhodospirillales bacterium]MBT4007497.1 cell envelope integrity EipB family protein [Rhodospirillales bacterium]MBT5075707.1 cell envelope integrity EipB family protein [Rhodospirillales bacterium]MBT5113211.1 cell envelope integrity EipB family protein [Rhodospirillales bacterium]MBT5671844.1 cell envelope integrity EipB family protein [Rhodospirillales bacterium]
MEKSSHKWCQGGVPYIKAIVLGGLIGLGPLMTGAGNAAPASKPINLAPHKAVYAMKIGHVRSGGNITGAKGTMVMEWARSCSGWTMVQRVQLVLFDNEGNRIATESNFSSFETLDGLKYRFTSRNSRDGTVTDDLEGKAKLARKGGKGHADFSRPKGMRFDLSRKTIFPTVHVIDLIRAARQGKKWLNRVIFDGANSDGPLEVNAMIFAPIKTPPKKWAKRRLTNRPSWHMRLAFFPTKSAKSTPDYELGLRLFDNGVADGFELDYGSFSVNASLEKITALKRPKCDS